MKKQQGLVCPCQTEGNSPPAHSSLAAPLFAHYILLCEQRCAGVLISTKTRWMLKDKNRKEGMKTGRDR